MKRSSIALATAIGVSCFSLGSCDTEDPSAAHEKGKDLVEATRKVATLEQEIASLKTENEHALSEATSKVTKLEEEIARLKTENENLRQKETSPEPKPENGLTATELDAKLKKAVDSLTERIDKIEKKLDTTPKPPTPKPPDPVPPAPVPPSPKPPHGTRVGPDGKLVIDGGKFDGQPVDIDTKGDPVLKPHGGR